MPELLELWATGLTALTLPSTVVPFGISTVTPSPTLASDCLLASNWTVTISCVELVCRIAVALAPLPLPDDEGLPLLDEEGLLPLPDDEGLPLLDEEGLLPLPGDEGPPSP